MAARARKPSERQRNHDLESLLRTCRPSGSGPALIAKLTRPLVRLGKKIGEERVAILVADASPGHYKLMCDRKFMLAEYLHVDRVQVQDSIADPLIAEAVRLGGVIVSFSPAKPAVHREIP